MKKTGSCRIHLFFIVWCLSALSVFSQKDFVVTQYDTQDGLPQKTVNAMQQDDNGYMWFATENGISRFDGQAFTNYRIMSSDSVGFASNRFDFMQEDIYGYFWILNYNHHIYRFNPGNGTFKQVLNRPNYKAKKINLLFNGDVWAHMEDGFLYRIYSHNGKTLHVQKIAHVPTSIKCVTKSKTHKDVICILTDENLLQYDANSNKLIRFFIGDGTARFNCLRRYSDHYLIGGNNGFLYRFDIETASFSKQKLPTDSKIRNLKAFSPSQILVMSTIR